QLEAIWQRSFAVARIRYEAGEGVQSDLLRAELELTRILQRRLGLQADERIRTQTLNRLRAHPLDEPIELHTHIRDLPALAAFEARFSVERALAESPELAAARLGITRADKSAALAEKGYYPDITVGAGVMYRGALPPMWTVTLGGPVPLFAGSRQSRAVAENRAWSSAAQKDVAAIEQGLRLRSAERHAAFSALLQQIALYKGLLVQSEATIESTLTQYRIGKVTFASVLEANAGYVADQEGYLEAIAAAHRILIAEAELSLDSTTMPAGAGSGGSAGVPGASAPAAAGGSSSGM
ncbi:MAG TPA: TolC family protein, partial [Polyangiaceae bacterium]